MELLYLVLNTHEYRDYIRVCVYIPRCDLRNSFLEAFAV